MSQPSTITRLLDQTWPLDDDALAEHCYPVPEAGTPLLRVNFVASADGAVEVGGTSAGLSSPMDQRVMGILRRQCDAVLLGAGTVRAEGYAPPLLDEPGRRWRQRHGRPEHPTLAVVSGSLDLDPAGPAFADSPVRPVILTHAAAPAARRCALERVAEVVTAGQSTVDPAVALRVLHARGLWRVLSEGGPHLLGSLTAADLVDELCLTVSPLLAGAGAGRITAGATSPPRPLVLRQVLAAGDHLLLRYGRAGGTGRGAG